MSLSYSLVIPCYNEAAGLEKLVEKCRKLTAAFECEIVLVDNGSNDASSTVLEDLLASDTSIRHIRVESNLGYGHGILSGLSSAQGDVLAWTHADLQTNPTDLIPAFKYFENHSEPEKLFIKGRRIKRPIADAFFTAGMSVFESILFRRKLYDINAQPTVFHREFYQTWAKDAPYDFSLDLFVYVLASRAELEISRFPVEFSERAFGHSHWNVDWQSKVKFIKRAISYSFELYSMLKNRKNDGAQ